MMEEQRLKIKDQRCNAKFKNATEERAYNYALKIIKVIDEVSKDMSAQIIAKQLLRSATSIGANIVEARSSSSRRDFTNFFNHALKSANETVFWLGLLSDAGKIEFTSAKTLSNEAREFAKILASSILTLKSKRNL